MDLTEQVTHAPRTYNASSRWFIPDDLLYFRGGLNPLHNYQITITNAADSLLSVVYATTGKVNEWGTIYVYLVLFLLFEP